jgi:branched-chain amino acid transport system substrate-binding protein
MKKRILWLGMNLLLVAVLATSAPTWKGPYKIGMSASLTGAIAVCDESAKAGAQLAVDQVNAQGGILGRPVQLIMRDDKLDPDEVMRVMKELHLRVGVDAMILPASGIVQTPALRYCKEQNILAFGAVGHDQTYLSDLMYPYYFVMGPTAYQEARGLAKHVADWKEIKTFVTIAPDYSWGHTNADAFISRVETLRPGIKLVGQFWLPPDEVEFSTYVTGILAKKADLVVTWLWGTPFASFLKQASAYKMLEQMHMTAWLYQDTITQAGADMPSGVTVEADNEYWTNRKNQNPYYEQFEKEYVARRGMPASLGGCGFYDIVMTLMQGIKKANSFDKDEIAKAIEGSTFLTLRGAQFMRPINHCYDTSVYFGVTKYNKQLGYCEVVDVTEIRGGEIMLPDSDYIQYRKEKGINPKLWHPDWAVKFPWLEK